MKTAAAAHQSVPGDGTKDHPFPPLVPPRDNEGCGPKCPALEWWRSDMLCWVKSAHGSKDGSDLRNMYCLAVRSNGVRVNVCVCVSFYVCHLFASHFLERPQDPDRHRLNVGKSAPSATNAICKRCETVPLTSLALPLELRRPASTREGAEKLIIILASRTRAFGWGERLD